ncbi:MAG TPA: DUF429 domain-containing protein [Mycobacteriales bacterium]|nr:DUF429 domain-containing protein [Mycobacteriales bacterium]
MLTAGVDLATEPSATALAIIEWSSVSAVVRSVRLDVCDDQIVEATGSALKLGVDCPLGWPDDFVVFLNEHHEGHVLAPQDVIGKDWRRRLATRATDRAVRQVIGLIPLSVAADRIALTAIRAAGLLGQLAQAGEPVDRVGDGVVVEVYPAASLFVWGLRHRGYKGKENQGVRDALISDLLTAAPWLDLGDHAALCSRSDDALDAVVAAMTSRAAALHQVTVPGDPQERAKARREGWIAVPTGPLGALI